MSLRYPYAEKSVYITISYFAKFGFSPNFDELFMFFPEKISKNRLKTILFYLVDKKKLVTLSYSSKTQNNKLAQGISRRTFPYKMNNLDYHNNLYNPFWNFVFSHLSFPVYTLPQYSIQLKNRHIRQAVTYQKLHHAKDILSVLSLCPFIRFIGITGSASMYNCKKNDDIDLCIVTQRNCLFTARFCVIFLLRFLSFWLKVKNQICLNLFFDESDLSIPRFKHTPYVAHELLQMKPIVNINHTYERFINKNKWIYDIFPNAPKIKSKKQQKCLRNTILTLFIKPFEYIVSKIQLSIIRKNRTGFYLTPTQLWLFKKDFEKRVNT